MKKQAESFLLHHCPNIEPIILRPSLVWHKNERNWSVPLAIATDLGYQFRKNVSDKLPGGEQIGRILPPNRSINLNVLTEYAVRGALGELNGEKNGHIWNNETMVNKKDI